MLSYAELLERKDAPAGSSWGLFGEKDELGTANFLTADRVAAAAKLIRTGEMFNLDCPLGAFDPPTSHQRKTHRHFIFGNNAHHRDDFLDQYYLQSGSQIDSLRHMRHPVHGFYNRMPDSDVVVGNPRNSVSRWAEHGLAGRGVLLDVDRHMRKRGTVIDQNSAFPITAALLDEIAAAQKVEIKPGDILMIRTGWLNNYFNVYSDEDRAKFPSAIRSPGLYQSHETLGWLWDHRIAICAADNPGVEMIPPRPDSPFAAETAGVQDLPPMQARLMHANMIALLGLILGELWNVEKLAERCAADAIWEMFVSVKPLNLIGGVGSPANAMAIR